MRKPETGNAFPAVVFIHGPEAGEREALRAFAKGLAEQGIAALLYEEHDAGEPPGKWANADLKVLAAEARAAVQYLQQRDDIRHDNVGVIGFGRGGWVAPLVAVDSHAVAFVMTLSTPFVADSSTSSSQHAPDSDPLAALALVRAPVLALFGEKDEVMPAGESATLFETRMREAGKKNFALRVVPNADHRLFTKPFHDSPLPLLQNLPSSPRVEPEALEAVAYWVKVVAPLHRSPAAKR